MLFALHWHIFLVDKIQQANGFHWSEQLHLHLVPAAAQL